MRDATFFASCAGYGVFTPRLPDPLTGILLHVRMGKALETTTVSVRNAPCFLTRRMTSITGFPAIEFSFTGEFPWRMHLDIGNTMSFCAVFVTQLQVFCCFKVSPRRWGWCLCYGSLLPLTSHRQHVQTGDSGSPRSGTMICLSISHSLFIHEMDLRTHDHCGQFYNEETSRKYASKCDAFILRPALVWSRLRMLWELRFIWKEIR
jgi:hypothetical protein